jgi:hypothetical protein
VKQMIAKLFDLEDYAGTYRETRNAYLKAANQLKLATGPYKVCCCCSYRSSCQRICYTQAQCRTFLSVRFEKGYSVTAAVFTCLYHQKQQTNIVIMNS